MHFDLIVVGGGPAGLSAAYAASKAGVRVAVLEKSKEIGYPIHTSGGSWIAELEKLAIPSRFMHPISEGLFLSTGARAFFKYDVPPSCVLDVRGLYQYLAEQAASHGSEIMVNTSVTAAQAESGKVTGVKARRFGREMLLEAPLVIDASGVSGILARQCGLSAGRKRVGVGAEYDLFAPDWPANRVAFLFGAKFAPCGYGWVFPHRESRVRVGVGVIRPDTSSDPRRLLENILSDQALFDGRLSRASRLEYHKGTIPSDIYLKRTVSNGLMVVGDAGGMISTLLGEGIRFAIDIGRMAGEVGAEAVRSTSFDGRYLRRFEKRWHKKYKRTFQLGAYVNRRLAAYTDEDWDKRISALARLSSQEIPDLLQAKFTATHLSRILRSNPKFIRYLLRGVQS